MRQYVSNLLIVPAIAQNDACGLTGWNGEIVIDQDCWNTRVLVHEFGHAMDRWAMQDLDSNFHWSRTSQSVLLIYRLSGGIPSNCSTGGTQQSMPILTS